MDEARHRLRQSRCWYLQCRDLIVPKVPDRFLEQMLSIVKEQKPICE